MTREEAIQVYKDIINPKIREAFEVFAPELASEDEKIRRTLAEHYKEFKREDMWDENISIGQIIDWFEKQRESEQTKNDRYMEGYQKGYADAERTYNNGVAFHIDNPNIQRLDPNVVRQSTTDGTHE